MKDSALSQHALFSRLFGGLGPALGAMAAEPRFAATEAPVPSWPGETVSHMFDGEGRLLSITYDRPARGMVPVPVA